MILSGIRVLDLTRLLPGPFATQWLVAMGAEVIRVEPPTGGDWLREMPPFVEGLGAWFIAVNRGKKSVAIDLKQPEGRELFLRLVRSADVVVEGFRPGVMARLGLAPEFLLNQQPRLVYASLTGYGRGSRWRERAGHDLNYLALAGFLGLSGPREGPPVPPAVPVADFGGAMALLIAVLAGLLHRERTGQGVILDASIFEVVVTWMQPFWGVHRAGLPAAREGMPLNGALPCYRVYVTADGGAMALAALEPAFWQAFCEAVGHPEWIPRIFDPALIPEVAALFRSRTRQEWEALRETIDACLEPVLEPEEAIRSLADLAPAFQAELPGLPFTLEGQRLIAIGPPPRLGEHTVEILKGVGVEPMDLEDLARRGIIRM
ncbi:CaiB/BaiF CoA transferase family protein [Thermoflexus sp.]|uniref:CaiB/BaiF CoA transferase family protein n=1 Tax=Thermoflexus sp. TaxID=1969742 RepID=UPI0025FEF32A|nr:CoA transferase [Thermoflexus sp.]MCS7351252.1 CoA transferase [Thermoflexus sp.]MCX7690265.1 CoA transferase [Thermoflexus sp.]MDW8180706.1 CoA transferase [Anaerolineae bacterium]MDW8186180.1 CoA transferase [Anaerolineae bacterium]